MSRRGGEQKGIWESLQPLSEAAAWPPIQQHAGSCCRRARWCCNPVGRGFYLNSDIPRLSPQELFTLFQGPIELLGKPDNAASWPFLGWWDLTERKQFKPVQQCSPPQGRQNMKASNYKTPDVQNLSETRSEKYLFFSQDKLLFVILPAYCSPLPVCLPSTTCPPKGACIRLGDTECDVIAVHMLLPIKCPSSVTPVLWKKSCL